MRLKEIQGFSFPIINMSEKGQAILKILCIHGYRQNGQTFRERTGAFRKIIKKHAELVFITAPNVVPPMESEDGASSENKDTDHRGWWFSREDDYFKAHDDSNCCKGYDKSLDVIREAFNEHGPFDGVLAFSQGASMLSLVCGLLQQHGSESGFRFDFAIFIAGFRSRSSQHQSMYEQTITLPSLHVFGDTDQVIPKEMSESMVPIFQNAKVLNHPGGHFVPASSAQKKVYLDFLDEMKYLKSERLKS